MHEHLSAKSRLGSLKVVLGHVDRDSSVTLVGTFVNQVCSSQGLLQGPVRPLELGCTVAPKKGKIGNTHMEFF